jgi:uncharacterized protein (DUF2249 family)
MSQTDVDHEAADAVVAHHSELAAALTRRVALLRAAARAGSDAQWREHRQDLLTWLRTELLPHAAAEEQALYPPAMADHSGRLLVEGMLGEHRAITRLVAELETAGTAVDAAGAARALAALLETHIEKENSLIVPLLLGSDTVSLAGILGGMHERQSTVDSSSATAKPAHGACGCGGDRAEAAAAPAPVLTVDARLDVRTVPHAQRHARVLTAISELAADGALVLIAPHAPIPLLAEIDRRFPAQIDTEWLQEGPEVWQIRLHRQFAPAA